MESNHGGVATLTHPARTAIGDSPGEEIVLVTMHYPRLVRACGLRPEVSLR